MSLLIAIGLLGYALYANVYPIPPAPYNYFPYGVLAWVLVGIVIVLASPAGHYFRCRARSVFRALLLSERCVPSEIHWATSQAADHRSALIASVDPNALDPKDASRLQRAFNKLP